MVSTEIIILLNAVTHNLDDSHPPRHPHARALVLVDVEAIHLDLRRDESGQRRERAMEAEHRRDEIDERRFFSYRER